MIKLTGTRASFKIIPAQTSQLRAILSDTFQDIDNRELVLNNGKAVGYSFKASDRSLQRLIFLMDNYRPVTETNNEQFRTATYYINNKLKVVLNVFFSDSEQNAHATLTIDEKYHT